MERIFQQVDCKQYGKNDMPVINSKNILEKIEINKKLIRSIIKNKDKSKRRFIRVKVASRFKRSILKNIYRRRVNRRTGVRHYGKK